MLQVDREKDMASKRTLLVLLFISLIGETVCSFA